MYNKEKENQTMSLLKKYHYPFSKIEITLQYIIYILAVYLCYKSCMANENFVFYTIIAFFLSPPVSAFLTDNLWRIYLFFSMQNIKSEYNKMNFYKKREFDNNVLNKISLLKKK
jgi:hypothetical protein